MCGRLHKLRPCLCRQQIDTTEVCFLVYLSLSKWHFLQAYRQTRTTINRKTLYIWSLNVTLNQYFWLMYWCDSCIFLGYLYRGNISLEAKYIDTIKVTSKREWTTNGENKLRAGVENEFDWTFIFQAELLPLKTTAQLLIFLESWTGTNMSK